MVYAWKDPKYTVDAQLAGEELERIKRKYGAKRAADIVRESKPENAVLHPLFEWDDAKAAKEYRCQQAREIKQNIVVIRETEVKQETSYISVHMHAGLETKAFQVKATRPPAPTLDVPSLENALRELAAFRQRYAGLPALNGVMREIELLLQGG